MRTSWLGGALLTVATGAALTACGAASTPPAAGGGGGGAAAAPVVSATTAPAATEAPPAAAPKAPATPTRPKKPAKPTTPRQPAGYDPARDITDLAAATTGLTLDKPVQGIRHGDLVVTITNNGPHPVWGLTFAVELPESMTADGGDWAGCTPLKSTEAGYPAGSECQKGYLAAGASKTYRLGVRSPASQDGADSTISRWLVDVWSGGRNGAIYNDAAPDDNRRFFQVTRR
ncbi:hypothetical protein WEI85_28015 [Actinomycetes bacterium KLBMP 9797]